MNLCPQPREHGAPCPCLLVPFSTLLPMSARHPSLLSGRSGPGQDQLLRANFLLLPDLGLLGADRAGPPGEAERQEALLSRMWPWATGQALAQSRTHCHWNLRLSRPLSPGSHKSPTHPPGASNTSGLTVQGWLTSGGGRGHIQRGRGLCNRVFWFLTALLGAFYIARNSPVSDFQQGCQVGEPSL